MNISQDNKSYLRQTHGLPKWLNGKEYDCQCRRHKRHGFSTQVGKIPLEEEMATLPYSCLGKIPWVEECGGLQSMGLQSQTWLEWLSTNAWQIQRKNNTQWWKAESLPTKIWKKIRMPTLTSSIQHSTGSPSHGSQIRKEIKGIQSGKEEAKLSL